MLTRVGNLILASLALMVSLIGEAGCHSALSPSPPHPHGPITIREVVMDLIVIFWFAGAVGLFSRKRLAWIGSLIGVGASACFFAATLVSVTGLWLSPSSDSGNTAVGIRGVIATVMTIIVGVGGLGVFLVICIALFIGLLKMRKELR